MATKNYVAELNEYAQRNRLKLKYEYLGSDGPDHNKVFSQKAIIDGKDYPKGVGKTKKDAKVKAAENALRCLLDGKCQDLTENAAEASTSAETDINFICWLNEYGQRNRLTIKPMETTRPGPNNAIPWCSFMVGEKEYPAVSGKTAREAKEEAAKLVYDIINGNKTTDEDAKDKNVGNGQNEMPTVSRFTSEFEPLEHLGKGAFGSVYKVKDKQLKIEYAVKIGCYKEKSLREVRTLSDLFHRNIVRYYTFWMQDTGYDESCGPTTKFLYIQMELCAKNTLRDWIDEKNKESVQNLKRREESLRIAQEIVCGVEYIHSRNHIHRDLKPANIMFGVEGEVKIGDFGLVTSDDDDEERTVCKGTPSYMAPEQRKYDRKVDMFALGLIFFELLWKLSTGSERAKIWPDVRRQRFPEEFSVTFTKEKQIINSLLSEKPEDRPDASAVKAELEEWTQIFNSHKASHQENQTV
uniref:non-specific serine/threonine protein kinase n=1 Tax=Neolamprologus brichardi TaxID=32507 RepID=A0A3Q4H239_NEOBR